MTITLVLRVQQEVGIPLKEGVMEQAYSQFQIRILMITQKETVTVTVKMNARTTQEASSGPIPRETRLIE